MGAWGTFCTERFWHLVPLYLVAWSVQKESDLQRMFLCLAAVQSVGNAIGTAAPYSRRGYKGSSSVGAVFSIPIDVAVALHSVQEDKAVIFLFTF